MNNPTEKQLSQLNEGREAHLTLRGIGPIIEQQALEIIRKFKMEFRGGTLDLSKSLAFAAELCTIEDIENKLKQKINVAESLQKKDDKLNATRNSY